MQAGRTHSFYHPRSVADAVAALADRGSAGAPLAGATWIMRAPLRAETEPRAYVAIAKLPELSAIDIAGDHVAIGACVTHASMAECLSGLPELHVLAMAAGRSANPAVRQMATLGGNLCSRGFAAADLVPALLCLDAEIEIETRDGVERLSVGTFLHRRDAGGATGLVRRVIIARRTALSAHARLPLRKAGDYPVAIVSLSVVLRPDGRIDEARIGVGSVEAVARRWPALEQAIVGHALDPAAIGVEAATLATQFNGRDGIEAPGWYPVKVLPVLVRRAFEALRGQNG